MKRNRGFAPVLIALIIPVILILSGGAYYLNKNLNNNKKEIETEKSNIPQENINTKIDISTQNNQINNQENNIKEEKIDNNDVQINEQANSLEKAIDDSVLCSDSDGGIDYYKSGSIKSTNPTYNGYVDSCGGARNANPDPNKLGEVYCNEDGSVTRTMHDCPQGCFSSVCINVANPSCSDTDEGVDIYKSGSINFNTQEGPMSISDYCYFNDVVEMSCDGIKPYNKLYSCSEGCSNGACKESIIKENNIPQQNQEQITEPFMHEEMHISPELSIGKFACAEDDFNCMLNAAENCKPAILIESAKGVFPVEVAYEIIGLENGLCRYYEYFIGSVMVNSNEQNKITGIDSYSGTSLWCLSSTTDLILYLKGSFKQLIDFRSGVDNIDNYNNTDDFMKANCKGSMWMI